MEGAHSGVGTLQVSENSILSSGADLLAPLLAERGVLSGTEVVIRPLALTDDGPLEFNIEPRGNQFVQLYTTRMYLKLKIVDENGANMAELQKVAPVDGASSLFYSILCVIDGKSFPDLDNSLVGYKDIIQTLLTYSPTAAKSHLRNNMIYMDLPETEAYESRLKLCEKSKTYDLCFVPPLDLLMGERFLPAGHRVTLKFTRNPDSFCLLRKNVAAAVANADQTTTTAVDTKKWKIKIQEAQLFVRYLEPHPDQWKNLHQLSPKQKLNYPFKRTVVHHSTHPKGLSSLEIPNLFQGQLPKHIVIAMVSSKAFHGDYDLNPYTFQHYNIKELIVRLNCKRFPEEGYGVMDFENGLVARAFRLLYDNTGILHDNASNLITKDSFLNGATLFPLDFSPDKTNGYFLRKSDSGLIDLDLRFNKPLPESITVLVFAAYDAVLTFLPDNSVELHPAL